MPTRRNENSEPGCSKRRWLIAATGTAICLTVAIWGTNRAENHGQPDNSHVSPVKKPESIKTSDNLKAERPPALVDAAAHIRALWFFKSSNERLDLMRSLQGYGAEGYVALQLLQEFLSHPDQAVRRAAMRGLAATQSAEAIALLQRYLTDTIAIEESTEAALALATMESSSVTPILQTALENVREATLREHVVDALASRPQKEVGAFIETFLRRSDVGLEEKQNLLRMTGLNSTKSAEFLAGFLSSNEEQLRHGAYQGLALVSDSQHTQRLIPKIQTEIDPSDRGLVYDALGNQLDANPASLGTLADAEKDGHARLRALKAWAESAGRQGALLSGDTNALQRVEELQNAALHHADFTERRVAIFALGFIRKDYAARNALEQIAQTSSSEKIRALAQGLIAKPN